MKVKIVFSVVVFALSLIGCTSKDYGHGRDNPDESKVEYVVYPNRTAMLWVDPETGCEYISGSLTANMTPRLNRQGAQICR